MEAVVWFVCLLVGWLVAWLVDMVGWLVWLVGWLVVYVLACLLG
jgi:hypothetical protein